MDTHARRRTTHAKRVDTHAKRVNTHAKRVDTHAKRVNTHAKRVRATVKRKTMIISSIFGFKIKNKHKKLNSSTVLQEKKARK